jgi:hypothetical protein
LNGQSNGEPRFNSLGDPIVERPPRRQCNLQVRPRQR